RAVLPEVCSNGFARKRAPLRDALLRLDVALLLDLAAVDPADVELAFDHVREDVFHRPGCAHRRAIPVRGAGRRERGEEGSALLADEPHDFVLHGGKITARQLPFIHAITTTPRRRVRRPRHRDVVLWPSR